MKKPLTIEQIRADIERGKREASRRLVETFGTDDMGVIKPFMLAFAKQKIAENA